MAEGSRVPIKAADARYRFGYDWLGPIVADYCARLLAHALSFERELDGKVLFVARAGVRIRRAVEVFAARAGVDLPLRGDYLWASRLMVAKGVWRRSRSKALHLLSKEFAHASLKDFVTAMFRHDGLPASVDLNDPTLTHRASDLSGFLASHNPAARAVEDHLCHQSELFESYVTALTRDHDLALLVDTGWQGTAQSMLDEAFPQITWWGAYFGRFSTGAVDQRAWPRMIGVVTEHESYDPEWPESSVMLHRHLIEHLFQPTGPSIERLEVGADGIFSPEAQDVLGDDASAAASPMFAGVLDYLAALPDGAGVGALRRASQAAWREVARVITLPTIDDVALFSDVKRSADFGRSLEVPLLLPAKNRRRDDSPDARVRDSLWHAGQLAIEYPREIALPMQRKLAGIGRNPLADALRASAATCPVATPVRRPKVAIITRTLDRPIFLRRALASVARQTFKDYVHIIVNDGGDNDVARETIEKSSGDLDRTTLIDNVVNRGMEAASNIAIRHCDTDYVVIHDDDDTWEPRFLEKTVTFLESSRGQLYDGVITHSTYVSESVTASGIVIHGSGPYNGWVETVHLHEMAVQNFFPPIAFVFRRSRYDAIGGYDERYPVLGDWDFNLRFLSESNIAVLSEALANYHHRDRGDTAVFGNSVIADRHKHLEYSAVVRNNLVRYLTANGRVAEASMIGLGVLLGEDRDLGRRTNEKLDAIMGSARALGERGLGDSPRGVELRDALWVASQRLSAIVARGDVVALSELGLAADPRDLRQRGMRLLAKLVGLTRPVFAPIKLNPGGVGEGGRLVERLVALHRDPYRNVPEPDDFDELRYLRENPDVASAVSRGELVSGFEHYFYTGRREGRSRPSR